MRASRLFFAVRIVSGATGTGTTRHTAWDQGPAMHDVNSVKASSSSTHSPTTDATDAQGAVHNPAALPNTIPGISREELQRRLEKFQTTQMTQKYKRHEELVSREIDEMRRAMPPDQFAEFMENVNAKEAMQQEELRKVQGMTPTEYHRYMTRKKRRDNFWQWVNVWAVFGVFMGGIGLIVYFLLYFFY